MWLLILLELLLYHQSLYIGVGIVKADKCGGNCPSNGCSTADGDCLCGTTKKVVDIANWCAKFNWNQKCCQCIVTKESEGNANAVHRSGSSYNVGLWQINSVNWAQCNGDSRAPPCDPQANLNCAIQVYRWGGNSWKPWSTSHRCGPSCS
jgi:hypothetical protein